VCLIWAALSVVLHVRLARRDVAPEIKYLVGITDAAMITLLCALAGGPKSPLVLLFFVLVATAPLRMSLRFVYAGTTLAILGYLIVLAHYAWYVIGYRQYYATPALRIPRRQEAIVVLALLTCGFLASQSVRQARRLANASRHDAKVPVPGAGEGNPP